MRVRADSVDGVRVRGGQLNDGGPARELRRLDVDVSSAAELRASLSGPLAWLRSRRFTVRVASWQPPLPDWSAPLGPLPGVLDYEVRRNGDGPGAALVRVVLADPLPFQLVAAAVLRALVPDGRLPLPVSPDVAAYGPLPAWLPPWDNVAGLVGDSPDEQIIRPYDIVRPGPAPSSSEVGAAEVGAAGSGAVVSGAVVAQDWGVAAKVVLDAMVTNPRGYRAGTDIDATAELRGDGLTIRAGADAFTESAVPLPADRIAAVRGMRSIRIDAVDGPDAARTAVLLAQLAMTGVVVHTPTALPPEVADRLAAAVVAVLAEPLPGGDPTDWEARSVRQRRSALRHHASAWSLPAACSFPDQVRTPSVSAILLLTRPEAIRSALTRLAGQDYTSLELVLAFDETTMEGAVQSALDELTGLAHRTELVRVPAGTGPEEAYALAAGRARGSLVTGFEQDADYGAEHVWDLVLARHYSGASVVGKACEFFAAGPDTAVRHPAGPSEDFTDSLSDGPVLVARADLIAAGGWSRILAGPGYRTHPFGFVRPSTQEPVASRSATDRRTLPLMVATS